MAGPCLRRAMQKCPHLDELNVFYFGDLRRAWAATHMIENWNANALFRSNKNLVHNSEHTSSRIYGSSHPEERCCSQAARLEGSVSPAPHPASPPRHARASDAARRPSFAIPPGSPPSSCNSAPLRPTTPAPAGRQELQARRRPRRSVCVPWVPPASPPRPSIHAVNLRHIANPFRPGQPMR
jgi:hypothetical protein